MTWPSLRAFLCVPTALTGKGIRIALVDGSFASHPDVTSNVTRKTFLVNAADASPSPRLLEATASRDWFRGGQHGTWAAAAAAGSGALSGGVYAGVAPEAELLLVEGWAPRRPHASDEQDRVASLEWVRRHWREYGIRAVLTSHANYESALLPWQTEPQHRAAEALAAEGVLVVAGTGNGADVICHVGLAGAPSTLAVGGVVIPEHGNSEQAAPYHGCRGTTFEGKWVPEVLAPAENLVLPYFTEGSVCDHFLAGTDAHVLPHGYARTEGASFSGPVVLGAAACVWQAHPEWTAGQVAAALVGTAIQRPQWADLRAGLLSVVGAVEAAPEATPAPAIAQDRQRHETPFARWQSWRQRPVTARLATVQGSDPERVVEALLSFLPDEAPDEVIAAARSLAMVMAGGGGAGRLRTSALCVLATRPVTLTADLLVACLQDPDPRVRAAALHALGRQPGLWREVAPAFGGVLHDVHPDVRYRALRLAADMRDARLVPALVSGLDEDARRAVLSFLARCTALAATTGVTFPEEPAWIFGECRYTEQRRQARVRVGEAWRSWLAQQQPAV